MPRKPSRPCRNHSCPALTDDASGYCPKCLSFMRKQQDADRGTAAQRGYDSRWHRRSRQYLAEHPLCAECQKKTPPGVTAATLVDHIIPHRGAMALFWDELNWQALCTECHNVKTAKEDGAFGNPTRH